MISYKAMVHHHLAEEGHEKQNEDKIIKTKCRMIHSELDCVYDRPLRKFVHTFAFLILVIYVCKETRVSQRQQQQQQQQHDDASPRSQSSRRTKKPSAFDVDTSHVSRTEKTAIAPCNITDPDVLSAIQRAHSSKCKQLFMNVACARREDETVTDDSISVGSCRNPALNLSTMSAPLRTNPNVDVAPLAFIIMAAGRGARQIGQLLRVLHRKQNIYIILVHVSNTYLTRTLRQMTAGYKNIVIHQVPYDIHWANPLRFRMLYLTLGRLLRMESSWHHVVILEWNDFPVRTVDELSNYLAQYKGRSFIFTERASPSFAKALGLHHLFIECEGRAWRIGRRELPNGLQLGIGYSRMILARNIVTYFVQGADQFINNMRAYWTFSLNPFESFFQTLALNTAFCERLIPSSPFWRLMYNEERSCDCQDQHLYVDWCSCAGGVSADVKCCFPYSHGIEDVTELLKIVKMQVEKPLFFATKFDSLISQSAINKVHIDVHGKIKTGSRGLNHYWYNVYHHLDNKHIAGDTAITYFTAFARMTLSRSLDRKSLTIDRLLEVHVLFQDDVMRGFLVKFEVERSSSGNGKAHRKYVIESYIQRIELMNVKSRVKYGSALLTRLKAVTVTSNYSPQNLTFDPLGVLIGPFSVIDFVTSWDEGDDVGNFSTVFYDPTREMVAVYEVTVPMTSYRHNVRTEQFRWPLRPGWWTIRYYDGEGEFFEPFLVLPLSQHLGKSIETVEQAKLVHAGPKDRYLDGDYGLPKPSGMTAARLEGALNARKTGDELIGWIDDLIGEQWTVRDVCRPEGHPYPDWLDSSTCEDTDWSSYSADIKSRVD